jgi:hypothetical protein
MKIIINESQLRQIIESEKKDRLYPLPANDFVDNWEDFINTYNRKNKYDGFELDGDLDLSELDVEDIEKILNEVVIINGTLEMDDSLIESLGRLEKVNGDLSLKGTKIKDLNNLTEVDGDLNLEETQIETLSGLTSVGGYLLLNDTPIKDLGKLKSVGRGLYLTNTRIKSLKNEFRVMEKSFSLLKF